MRIEERHFTAAQNRMKRLEEELKDEYQQMTDEERREEQNEITRQYEKLRSRIAENKKHTKQIISEGNLKRFDEMSKKSLLLARELQTDIFIEITENFSGRIRLETNFILINQEIISPRYRDYLAELILNADDVIMTAAGDTYTIEFLFPLYDEIQI